MFLNFSYIKEDEMATIIFVRERRKVEKGEKKPRFRVVGVSGSDVKIYVRHMRKKELEQICAKTGAEAVFLKAGKGQKDGGGQEADTLISES
jgi:hypothetical protein